MLIAAGPLDVLITHDAPPAVPLSGDFELSPQIVSQTDKTRVLLRDVVEDLAVPHVFCDHSHQRRTYELEQPGGRISRVDALNKENSHMAMRYSIWPGKAPLRIEPLFIPGN